MYVTWLCNVLQVQSLGVQYLNIALPSNSELLFNRHVFRIFITCFESGKSLLEVISKILLRFRACGLWPMQLLTYTRNIRVQVCVDLQLSCATYSFLVNCALIGQVCIIWGVQYSKKRYFLECIAEQVNLHTCTQLF